MDKIDTDQIPLPTMITWCILAILGALVLVTGMVMFDAFVLTKLWGWFVVPTFGLTSLSIPVTIGLVAMSRLMVRHYPPVNSSEESKALALGKLTGYVFITPCLALLIGWIAKLFI